MILSEQDRGFLLFNMSVGTDWTVPSLIIKDCNNLMKQTIGTILETLTGYYVRVRNRQWAKYMQNYNPSYIKISDGERLYEFLNVDNEYSGYALKSDTFYYIHNRCHA